MMFHPGYATIIDVKSLLSKAMILSFMVKTPMQLLSLAKERRLIVLSKPLMQSNVKDSK